MQEKEIIKLHILLHQVYSIKRLAMMKKQISCHIIYWNFLN